MAVPYVAGNFRMVLFCMRILHVKIKTTKICTIELFCVNFELATRGEDHDL